MKDKLIKKLYEQFDKDITEESHVIYIISLIRKLIEIRKNDADKYLKFYCNWALHIEIHDTELIRNKLKDENIHHLYTLMDFQNELDKFFKDNALEIKFFDNQIIQKKFCKILSKIYEDTPLTIKTTLKEEVIFNKIEWGENGGNTHHAQYTRREIQ